MGLKKDNIDVFLENFLTGFFKVKYVYEMSALDQVHK
jgi:hypothetical protein